MNFLVLNGSPKGANSNTLRVTHAFLEGLNTVQHQNTVDIVCLQKMNIAHCLGCYHCWTLTPGCCVIQDAMPQLMEKYIRSDAIVWSFPLYCYGMPSKIKAFLDRLLPTKRPELILKPDGSGGHPQRYDASAQQHLLISTCGFHSVKNNYDALFRQFEILFGNRITTIACTEGELLAVPQLAGRVEEYLAQVRQAGREFAISGVFSPETRSKLEEPLYPAEAFLEMANAHWALSTTEPEPSGCLRPDQTLLFMRQMASSYRPKDYRSDIVLEISFKDIEKSYQLVLGKEKCVLRTDGFTVPTTKIEVSFDLWRRIAEGKANGAEALLKRKYRIEGDFNTFLHMGDYFSKDTASGVEKDTRDSRKTNMGILLFPWVIFWILLPFHLGWGGVIGIALSSPLIMLDAKYKLTVYDRISIILASILNASSLLAVNSTLLISLSYLLFGMMWLTSCFVEIPLTAHYSCKVHGGAKAFANPIFMRTNRILTSCWGVLYILFAPGAYALMHSPAAHYTGIILTVMPAFLGVFTAWFSRWYPEKLAKW